MTEIAEHIFNVFDSFGYDYTDCIAIVDEIVEACEVTGMTPQDFDDTLANYRTQYTGKPSGWRTLAKFRPRRSDHDKIEQQAASHIFHLVEREGWQRGLEYIYQGICGPAPQKLARQWRLDAEEPDYTGLPETWQRYFDLLHSGSMYAAYVFMAHSTANNSHYWQQLANQAELNPELALSSQPYLKQLVRTGKVKLINPPPGKRKKLKWVLPARQETSVSEENSNEFLFELDDNKEGQ